MSKQTDRLCAALTQQMTRSAKGNLPMGPELGVIGPRLSLIPDSLRKPIPKGSYLVDLILTHPDYNVFVTTHTHDQGIHGGHQGGSGAHFHDGGDHTHRVPDVFRGLQEGDRVLLIWCGNEPVVVAIVVES